MRDEPAFDAPPSKLTALWVWIAILGVMLMGFWATISVVIPRQKKRFDELGVMLPHATRLLIDFVSFFHAWGFAFVVGSVAAYVGLVVLAAAKVFPPNATRRLAQLATILLLAVLIVTGVALSLPMIKVAEGLAK